MKRLSSIILIFSIVLFTLGSYASPVGAAEKRVAAGFLKTVKFSMQKNSEYLDVSVTGYTDFSIMRLSLPDRIVLDIFNAAAPGKQQHIKCNGNTIKYIRYAQFDTYTARVVLTVNGQAEYGMDRINGGLRLYIGGRPDQGNKNPAVAGVSIETDNSSGDSDGKDNIDDSDGNGGEGNGGTYADVGSADGSGDTAGGDNGQVNSELRNIRYFNNGDRVYLKLSGARLTSGEEFLKKLYNGDYSISGEEYSITFPSELADLGEGILRINDRLIRSIEVKNNVRDALTTIKFNATKKLSYLVYTRSNLNDTAITILETEVKGNRLVVIDPGHGGQMSGAIYKGLFEKELNLDISLRLNKLLKKQGVKTYMIRNDDTDVNNYERAYIANMLKASLFISIHNNAMDDPGYGGTMTLYYPPVSSSDFTGKTFAAAIQKKLYRTLGTVNRLTIERPKLVVLRATLMPSALAEIAFMTNLDDRNKLRKESFRQKAAQALCDSIVNTLSRH